MIQHIKLVGIDNRAQAMGDHDGGAIFHQPRQRTLHMALAFGVERRGRFVQQQDRRIAQHGAGDGDALALAARQFQAAFADARIVAVRQLHDEFVRRRVLRRTLDIRSAGAGSAQRDIVGDAFVEQDGVLGHQSDIPAKRSQRDVADVVAVDFDRSGIDVVKAQQQVEECRLAGAGRTDQRDLRARCDLYSHIADGRTAVVHRVSKGDILEFYRAALWRAPNHENLGIFRVDDFGPRIDHGEDARGRGHAGGRYRQKLA